MPVIRSKTGYNEELSILMRLMRTTENLPIKYPNSDPTTS
ncbi:MAG: hypothetical protein BWZ00_01811 [Bacteroidetes bacterium ADurb.BinA174]|nr:MAG: hypothetical protein BWZ00_01811 [Bacteroidetes bacterium ADurb.BinA174]